MKFKKRQWIWSELFFVIILITGLFMFPGIAVILSLIYILPQFYFSPDNIQYLVLSWLITIIIIFFGILTYLLDKKRHKRMFKRSSKGLKS
jgi:hypothetical protein